MTDFVVRVRSRWCDVVVVVVMLAAVAVFGHFMIAEPLTLSRAAYPLQAPFAKLGQRCSPEAPEWLSSLTTYVIGSQYSLANQVAYISPGGELHHCESGWVGGMFRSSLVSVETRFRYASLTKLLTADAVLAQIDTGHLTLETRLMDLLPELRPVVDARIERITIRHLLSHGAGFDRFMSPDPMTQHNIKAWCPSNLQQLRKTRLAFEPGARQAYSNLGYCLLGVVLERLSGLSYRGYMEREYGLAARGLRFIDGPYLDDEVRYDFRNSPRYAEDYFRHIDLPALSSAAGLSGSAVEFAQLLHEIVRRQPLNLLSLVPDRNCKATEREGCYGASAQVIRASGRRLALFLQGGVIYGAVSKSVIDTEGGITVWLGSGMPLALSKQSHEFNTVILDLLGDYYERSSVSIVQ